METEVRLASSYQKVAVTVPYCNAQAVEAETLVSK